MGKYLDLEGLRSYDSKIKEFVADIVETATKGDALYTNLAEPLPNNTTDTSKWVNGYRFSSSGLSAQSGTTLSNLIPCTQGDVIRIKGVTLRESVDRVTVYFTYNGSECTDRNYWNSGSDFFECQLIDGVYVVTMKATAADKTVSGMRFAMPTPEDSSQVIITVNEEIVESNDTRMDEFDVRTTNLEIRVTALENIDDDNVNVTDASAIPDYWQDHLQSKIATVKALQDEGGKDCFSFVVMTDMHYPSNLGKRSPVLAKEILDKCDIRYALCLGDVQTRGCHNTKELLLAENEQIEEMLSPVRDRLLQTEGNHDGSYGWLDRDGDGTYNNTDSSGNTKEPAERETYVNNLTPAELNSAIYRKVGLVGDVHFDESGSGYYIDDTANKVRYIVLNTHCNDYELQDDGTSKYPKMWVFRFTQSQFDLVIEALNNIPSASWGVVVAGHCPLFQEIGDREIMQGVLNAYRNKTAYTGKYDGTAVGGVSYKNLAQNFETGRLNSSGNVSTSNATGAVTCVDYIPLSQTEGESTVIRIKGYGALTDYNISLYNNEKVSVNSTGADVIFGSRYSYDSENGIVTLIHQPNASYAFLRVSGIPTDTTADIVITVNEEITESADGGYDAVSVSCDFSNSKGELVGYFHGHTHLDSVNNSNAFKIIGTRCDAKEENTEALNNERVAGTITEQSFDVFTVNKATRTIHVTKIGAGDDREISY